jgi:hypothetical protein
MSCAGYFFQHQYTVESQKLAAKHGGKRKMLSRDCDGCPNIPECQRRFQRTEWGDKVYCADGTAHLIDEATV